MNQCIIYQIKTTSEELGAGKYFFIYTQRWRTREKCREGGSAGIPPYPRPKRLAAVRLQVIHTPPPPPFLGVTCEPAAVRGGGEREAKPDTQREEAVLLAASFARRRGSFGDLGNN